MLKLLFTNEENLLEIIYSNRIFIDPEAPTDIVIISMSNPIRLRIRFTDTDEAESFMEVLFEGDKINLAEIINTNKEMEIIVEEDEMFGLADLLNPEYLEDCTDEFEEDNDE